MSYKFNAGGYLTFKTYEDYEKTANIFEKYGRLTVSDFSKLKDKDEPYYYCDVCGAGYGYDEEDVSYTLAESIPYILEGQIDYEGEDSVLWRHQFNQEKGEWEELSGRIVYEKPTPFARKTPIQEEEEERCQ